jgi:hypothetical protein
MILHDQLPNSPKNRQNGLIKEKELKILQNTESFER